MILVIFLAIGALLVVGFPLLMIYYGIHREDPALTMHQKTNTDEEDLGAYEVEPETEVSDIDDEKPIYEDSDPDSGMKAAIFVKEWGEHYNLILTEISNNDIHFNHHFASYDDALARACELLEEFRIPPIDMK